MRDAVLKTCVTVLLALPPTAGWSQKTPQAPPGDPPATAEEEPVLSEEKLREIHEDAVLPEKEEEGRAEEDAETAPPPEVAPTSHRSFT